MQSQTVEMHKANVHSHHTYTAPYTAHRNPDFCAIYDFGLNKLIARNVFGFKCPSKWQSGFWQQFSFLHCQRSAANFEFLFRVSTRILHVFGVKEQLRKLINKSILCIKNY